MCIDEHGFNNFVFEKKWHRFLYAFINGLFFCPVSCFTSSSPFEHEHTMKRRLEDQEIVYAPQQQQPRRPQIQGITDNLQLSLPTSVVETGTDNMQPSTGIQYSLPQGYQVCKRLVLSGHSCIES